jgi:formylglycine-generating enzyme required for sulfatase activity
MNELDMTVLAVRCGKKKQVFGMSLKELSPGQWYAYWTFPLTIESMKVETSDRRDVAGFNMDLHYPGCPHCGAMEYYGCEKCGKYVCWDGVETNLVCVWCGARQSGNQQVAAIYPYQPATQSQTVIQTPISGQNSFTPATPIRQPSQPGLLDLGDGVLMEFVRIPAGEFRMGRDWTYPNLPESRKKKFIEESGEYPEHTIYLDEYWMGKYPVTNQQYYQYVRNGGGRAPGLKPGPKTLKGRLNYPVDYVNWEMAVDFCRWVSGITGKLVNLPTEAQWEKAARGTDARLYPWGDQEPNEKLANFGKKFEDGSHALTPVGKFPTGASPYGVLDMAGNINQWVLDWYSNQYYKESPGTNPAGPDSGKYRVMRGGLYYYTNGLLSSYYRHCGIPTTFVAGYGFRCVLVP